MSAFSSSVVDDTELNPFVRDLTNKVVTKLSRLPKHVVSRMTDEEVVQIMIKHPIEEVERIVDAELHSIFAPMGAVLSFLFPKKEQKEIITTTTNNNSSLQQHYSTSSRSSALTWSTLTWGDILLCGFVGILGIVYLTEGYYTLRQWWDKRRSNKSDDDDDDDDDEVIPTANAAQEEEEEVEQQLENTSVPSRSNGKEN